MSLSALRLSTLQYSSSTIYYNDVHNNPPLLFVTNIQVVHLFVHIRAASLQFTHICYRVPAYIPEIPSYEKVLHIINKKPL